MTKSRQSESGFVVEETGFATYKEFAERIIGVSGDTKTLARLLKERGFTTTLPAIKLLAEHGNKGLDVGLCADGYGNFFFVEHPDGETVEIGSVSCDCGRWVVLRPPLLDLNNKWRECRRFFLPHKP